VAARIRSRAKGWSFAESWPSREARTEARGAPVELLEVIFKSFTLGVGLEALTPLARCRGFVISASG
jgi:hypothetical protein